MRTLWHRAIRGTLGMAGALAIAACGYTDEGTGTKTLVVVATSTYVAGTTSTDNDAANTMDVQVDVKKADAGVAGAVVTITDGESGEEFSLTATDPDTPGLYAVSIPGYRRRIALSVAAGDDRLKAQLEGPGRHRIDKPKHADVVRLSSLDSHLNVRWSTDDGIAADEVGVGLQGQKQFVTRDDSGKYKLPVEALTLGAATLVVRRINHVRLAGGAGTSSLESIYEVRNAITIED